MLKPVNRLFDLLCSGKVFILNGSFLLVLKCTQFLQSYWVKLCLILKAVKRLCWVFLGFKGFTLLSKKVSVEGQSYDANLVKKVVLVHVAFVED